MPDERAVEAWVRRNEAARQADLAADRDRSMPERLEEAARLSRVATELRDNMRPTTDGRTG